MLVQLGYTRGCSGYTTGFCSEITPIVTWGSICGAWDWSSPEFFGDKTESPPQIGWIPSGNDLLENLPVLIKMAKKQSSVFPCENSNEL